MTGCVDHAYNGAVNPEWACDNDSQKGQKGHLKEYAGEFCPGGWLDVSGKQWAWTDGASCLHLGVATSWGFGVR